MISETLFRRFYPETRRDGTGLFYDWARQYLSPDSVVLNLGAGPATGTRVRSLRGEVKRVVGVDVDPVVLDNDELDEAHVAKDGVLPFADETFDLTVCDFVFEHVEQPLSFLREAFRVLKRGGHLFFRTPNQVHYVALISRLTPHRLHLVLANRVRGLSAEAHDPWPTWYRLNTSGRIRRLARECGFSAVELRLIEAEPSYLMFHAIPYLLGVAYERFVNSWSGFSMFRSNITGRLTR